MTKEERQSLRSAYKNLASSPVGVRRFDEGVRFARSINSEDYETLTPFLYAEYERTYKIGGGSIKIGGYISDYFVEVITNEGRELLFENGRQEAEFFVFICDMITAVLSPLFDKVKSDVLYAGEEEARHGKM